MNNHAIMANQYVIQQRLIVIKNDRSIRVHYE